jgi:hypothetical protein
VRDTGVIIQCRPKPLHLLRRVEEIRVEISCVSVACSERISASRLYTRFNQLRDIENSASAMNMPNNVTDIRMNATLTSPPMSGISCVEEGFV